MKKWQCTVCGYIHTGEEPPEKCPVCGADKSQFVEITESKEVPAAEEPFVAKEEIAAGATDKAADEEKPTPATAPQKKPAEPLFSYDGVTDLMVKRHLHPITVHFPNGIIPLAVIFIFLAAIFQFAGLAKASFYNMVFVLLTLPVVLFTGYNEWQKKYKGAMTQIFIIKITSALVVTVAVLIIVGWHLLFPEIMETSSTMRSAFLFIHLIMLAATALAGHIGGKLVFKD